jgi:hypothetical protein
MNGIERAPRAPGFGWLMRGASLGQASKEYIDHWRAVYQGYEDENRRFRESFAQRVPGVATRAEEKAAYEKWAAGRPASVEAPAAVVAPAPVPVAALPAAAPAPAPAATAALTPAESRAAAEWDAAFGEGWAARIPSMPLSERVVFLVRYLIWKSGRGELGDVKAETARMYVDDAHRRLEQAAEDRPEWLRARDLARRLDAAVSAHDAADARARAAAPRDKTAAYTALARAVQEVSAAKMALYFATRGVFATDEELDRFVKWALPRTRLLLQTWLTPDPWMPAVAAPATPAPPAPRPGAMAPAPSLVPVYPPGTYAPPAAQASAPVPASAQPPAAATALVPVQPAWPRYTPEGWSTPATWPPAPGAAAQFPFGPGIYRT